MQACGWCACLARIGPGHLSSVSYEAVPTRQAHHHTAPTTTTATTTATTTMAPSRATPTFLAHALTRPRLHPRPGPSCPTSRKGPPSIPTLLSPHSTSPAAVLHSTPPAAVLQPPSRRLYSTGPTNPPPPAESPSKAADDGPEPPDYLSAGERAVFEKVVRELAPERLEVCLAPPLLFLFLPVGVSSAFGPPPRGLSVSFSFPFLVAVLGLFAPLLFPPFRLRTHVPLASPSLPFPPHRLPSPPSPLPPSPAPVRVEKQKKGNPANVDARWGLVG